MSNCVFRQGTWGYDQSTGEIGKVKIVMIDHVVDFFLLSPWACSALFLARKSSFFAIPPSIRRGRDSGRELLTRRLGKMVTLGWKKRVNFRGIMVSNGADCRTRNYEPGGAVFLSLKHDKSQSMKKKSFCFHQQAGWTMTIWFAVLSFLFCCPSNRLRERKKRLPQHCPFSSFS